MFVVNVKGNGLTMVVTSIMLHVQIVEEWLSLSDKKKIKEKAHLISISCISCGKVISNFQITKKIPHHIYFNGLNMKVEFIA